jgi:hypothetical protein
MFLGGMRPHRRRALREARIGPLVRPSISIIAMSFTNCNSDGSPDQGYFVAGLAVPRHVSLRNQQVFKGCSQQGHLCTSNAFA